MPCNTVQTTSVKLEVADLGLLADALKALGYSVNVGATSLTATHAQHGSVKYDMGRKKLEQTTSYGQQAQDVNAIKVGYSTQVVKKVAAKFGWSLNDAKAAPGEAVHFQAKKRSF